MRVALVRQAPNPSFGASLKRFCEEIWPPSTDRSVVATPIVQGAPFTRLTLNGAEQ
jgi:hypothetical protein